MIAEIGRLIGGGGPMKPTGGGDVGEKISVPQIGWNFLEKSTRCLTGERLVL